MDEKGNMSKDFIIFVRIILLCQGRGTVPDDGRLKGKCYECDCYHYR